MNDKKRERIVDYGHSITENLHSEIVQIDEADADHTPRLPSPAAMPHLLAQRKLLEEHGLLPPLSEERRKVLEEHGLLPPASPTKEDNP